MHDDRARLREALAAALAAAQDARAPERVVGLLEGAYRSLDSGQFLEDDMIRWAEASLGAWRRWSSVAGGGEHRLLLVDPRGAIADAFLGAAAEAGLGTVRVVTSRTGTLEALATNPPTAIIFDLDSELAPTSELLEWLATDFPQIRRVGCSADASARQHSRQRALFHTLVGRHPNADTLRAALSASTEPRSFIG